MDWLWYFIWILSNINQMYHLHWHVPFHVTENQNTWIFILILYFAHLYNLSVYTLIFEDLKQLTIDVIKVQYLQYNRIHTKKLNRNRRKVEGCLVSSYRYHYDLLHFIALTARKMVNIYPELSLMKTIFYFELFRI